MPPIARFLPPSLAGIVFIVSFVAYMAAGYPLFGNPDTPWHLAAGDLIRASGLPDTDPWSYTANGAPWYNLSWAWDVLLSVIVQHGGLFGLYAYTAAFAAAILAALACTLKRRETIADFYILLTLLLTGYVLLSYFYPQPWLATLLLTVIFHHLLHLSRDASGWRPLCWLPPLMALWVNMHGGFAVGLSLIAFYAVEAQQTGRRAWLKRLGLCFAACGLACLINPYGIHIITGFLRTMHSAITPYLNDWRPVMIGTDINMTIMLLLFACIGNLRDARVPLADRMLAVAWLIYAVHTRRNFIVFAVVAAPYFSYSLQEFSRYAQGVRHAVAEIPDTPRRRLALSALAAALAALLFLTPFGGWLVPPERLSDDPYNLRAAIAAVEARAPKTRFINDYDIGGHLVYIGGGRWPVFVDGRAGTAYPERVLEDAMAFAMLAPGYARIFDAEHADGIIVRNNHSFAVLMRSAKVSGWEKIYANDSVSVFLRRR